MAALTRSRVSGRTLGWSLSTRETVWCETPASAATSLIAGGRADAFISHCLPSSRERSRAASAAATTPARTPWASSTCTAATVVPPGEDTRSRSTAGWSPDWAGERRGALDGGDRELRRQVPGEAEQHARLGHRVDQVERVRGPGAGDRGDRVEVLLLHPDDEPGGARASSRRGPRCPSRRVRAGGDRAGALADDGGRVRHDPDHRLRRRRAASRSWRSAGPAATLTTSSPPRRASLISSRTEATTFGLTASEHHVRAGRRLARSTPRCGPRTGRRARRPAARTAR